MGQKALEPKYCGLKFYSTSDVGIHLCLAFVVHFVHLAGFNKNPSKFVFCIARPTKEDPEPLTYSVFPSICVYW